MARVAGAIGLSRGRRVSQEARRQAHKMEALGRLTGGVAHDFNNLLMVISGGLDLLQKHRDPARRERVMQGMRQATQRGASLTRQLLASSRSQELQPAALDLREFLERAFLNLHAGVLGRDEPALEPTADGALVVEAVFRIGGDGPDFFSVVGG